MTLFDIIGAALHRNQTVGQIYRENCTLGVLPKEGFEWIKSVALKLKKPCAFLEGQRCRIYEVRPLPCMLFPEYQAVSGTLQALAAQVECRDYSCLHSPLRISKERAHFIRTLRGMLQQEVVVSDFHLFGRSPFWVDFSGLDDLVLDSHAQASGDIHTDSKAGDVTLIEIFDRLFRETFLNHEPLCSLENRITELDRRDIRKSIFEDLSDKQQISRLLGLDRDRPLVWTYTNGALKERRQSLTLREHMFL